MNEIRNRQFCIYVEATKEELENGFETDVLFDELKAGTRGYEITDDGVDYDERN